MGCGLGSQPTDPLTKWPARWFVLIAAVIAVGVGLTRAGLPSPYLLAAFVVGIGYAVTARRPLLPARALTAVAQGVIGVTAGSYLTRSAIGAVGAHMLPIGLVSVLTVVLSVGAGLVLARLSPVDRPTAAFGMIAGGAAGIISLSRELGADARLVAVMQYVRVLIIVAVTPVVAIAVFGMHRASHSAGVPLWNLHGAAYTALVVCGGLLTAWKLRLPGWTILGPMFLAAGCSLVDRALVAPIPLVLADAAFVAIGLDVGLRFTTDALREAGQLLPRALAVIVGMLVASAGFGVALAAATHVSTLDGYLATTPGGLTAVVALAVGGNTNTTFIISVQVLRTFLMLAAAPMIARRLASVRVGRP